MKKCILFILSLVSFLFFFIDVNASEYLKPKYEELELYTPNGSIVEYLRYESDMTEEYKNSILNSYSGYEIIGSPTFYYNCHAYAWKFNGNFLPNNAFQSCWIDNPLPYIEDKSYIEISVDKVNNGDIVTYWNDENLSHSGLIANYSIIDIEDIASIYVESKFGEGPLIRHLLTEADSYYNDDTVIKFYTRHYHLVSAYISISQTKHNGYCQVCETTITSDHNIYQEGLFYKCTECNYKESFIPIIKNGITYYLFAGDVDQILRNENEMLLYLIQSNNLYFVSDFNNYVLSDYEVK